MTIVGKLGKAIGELGKKVYAGPVSVKDGDTVDTGLTKIDDVVLTTSNAAHNAAATDTTGGIITIGLEDNTGAAVTVPETVYVLAIGE